MLGFLGLAFFQTPLIFRLQSFHLLHIETPPLISCHSFDHPLGNITTDLDILSGVLTTLCCATVEYPSAFHGSGYCLRTVQHLGC